MYPVMLTVKKRRCLVVGGGGVALRKLDGLLANGALVTVVAPEPIPAFDQLASEDLIRLERRPYQKGEAAGYALVIAATDDRAVNRQVFQDADTAGVWVNVADDPPLCSFHLPARVQRGSLQVALASEGEAPFAIRRLRQLLERRFGPEWAEWLEAAARFRRSVRRMRLPRAEQEARYDTFFGATVDPRTLSARVPTVAEEYSFLFSGRDADCGPEAPADLQHDLPETGRENGKGIGLVSLVGAGPGDAGLLTLRGWQRLMSADAVVYDRLAATALPCDLPVRVELHCVGKQAGTHPVPQEEINALLVRLAREGKRVVRLKGGDPYVFGRGGEEAEELSAHGVPFEVVPGVTAAVAVPAYAGVPVTHRREAVRATFVTAHETVKSDGNQVRWDLLAADPHATLLGYMGVTSLPTVVEQLLASGMDPETPAVMVEYGTTSGQRVVRSSVRELPEAVTAAGLNPPGLFIIGPTVRHAERLDWFGRRPLQGERLALVAPAGAMGEELELAGVEVVEVPLPLTPASRVVMGALPLSGCVLFTEDEVEALDEERNRLGWGPEVTAWCMSPEAADRARRLGWQRIVELDRPVTGPNLISAVHEKTRRSNGRVVAAAP
jgi:uroporphyrin-III C-methyltransferase/precorrin-2 dehydrogenase/sirohydrochlorin ferrochelatase